MLDAQGFEEEAQFVRGTVGHEHLDVFRKKFDSALSFSGEFCEQFKVSEAVALRDFPIMKSKDDLLELVAAQSNRGFAHDLPPCGLTGGVELLHSDTAVQMGLTLHFRHFLLKSVKK